MNNSYFLFFLLPWVWIIFVTMRRERQIPLPANKFWALVHSQEKPVVLLTTRGWFAKELCYVFPYQGLLFCTNAKLTETPEGVTLIGTGHSFSLP